MTRVAQVMTHIASKAQRESGPGAVIPEIRRANGRPAFVLLNGTGQDMIMTMRTNGEGQISWIYTLRNPLKLAAAKVRAR